MLENREQSDREEFFVPRLYGRVGEWTDYTNAKYEQQNPQEIREYREKTKEKINFKSKFV